MQSESRKEDIGEGFWARRKRNGSAPRDATGKEKVTFSGDRPTNRDIIGPEHFYAYLYILRSLTDFPSIYFYPLSLPFDLHFLRLLSYFLNRWKRRTYVRRAVYRRGSRGNLCRKFLSRMRSLVTIYKRRMLYDTCSPFDDRSSRIFGRRWFCKSVF